MKEILDNFIDMIITLIILFFWICMIAGPLIILLYFFESNIWFAILGLLIGMFNISIMKYWVNHTGKSYSSNKRITIRGGEQ